MKFTKFSLIDKQNMAFLVAKLFVAYLSQRALNFGWRKKWRNSRFLAKFFKKLA